MTKPLRYHAAVLKNQLQRKLKWHFGGLTYAHTRTSTDLPHKWFEHKSTLLRHLKGVDMRLQHNKVNNLRLAISHLDRILVRPGETFSLWKLVGEPTKRKGYLSGLVIANGDVSEGIGGGLCQLANLLYWMLLHTPLTVTERHHHSFDIFPDSGRVLPFGTGASIFYNYYDFQFRNDTPFTIELRLWLDNTYLRGQILGDGLPPHTYSIQEKNHRFFKDKPTGIICRENQIYRKQIDRRTGNTINEELIAENKAVVKYKLPEGILCE